MTKAKQRAGRWAAVAAVVILTAGCTPYSEPFARGVHPLRWEPVNGAWLSATVPTQGETVAVLEVTEGERQVAVHNYHVEGARGLTAGVVNGIDGPQLYLAGGFATEDGFKRGVRTEPWPATGEFQFEELDPFQWAQVVRVGGEALTLVRGQIRKESRLEVRRAGAAIFDYRIEGEIGDVGILEAGAGFVLWWRERGRSDRARLVVYQIAIKPEVHAAEIYRADDGYFSALGAGYYGDTLGLAAADDANNPGAAVISNGTFYLVYEQMIQNLSLAPPKAGINLLEIPLGNLEAAQVTQLMEFGLATFFTYANWWMEGPERRIVWLAQGLRGADMATSVYSAALDVGERSFTDLTRESHTTRSVGQPAVITGEDGPALYWIEDQPGSRLSQIRASRNPRPPFIDRGNPWETLTTALMTVIGAAAYGAVAATILNAGNLVLVYIGLRLLFALKPTAVLAHRRTTLLALLGLHIGLYGLWPLTVVAVQPSFLAWIVLAGLSAALVPALGNSEKLRSPGAFFRRWWLGTYFPIALGSYPLVFDWVREFGVFSL